MHFNEPPWQFAAMLETLFKDLQFRMTNVEKLLTQIHQQNSTQSSRNDVPNEERRNAETEFFTQIQLAKRFNRSAGNISRAIKKLGIKLDTEEIPGKKLVPGSAIKALRDTFNKTERRKHGR